MLENAGLSLLRFIKLYLLFFIRVEFLLKLSLKRRCFVSILFPPLKERMHFLKFQRTELARKKKFFLS
ncbi:hypothetical protein DLM75_22490 [Leptospira stimsonii]|uniref:Uncharacterized protein n=1 Tax=Leptospira stimsonii TaxID=2202203 RepID=A0A396YNG8_9LEPT|nr:hypothetical protein DLM75_22490 [Leptospira stimsonii]